MRTKSPDRSFSVRTNEPKRSVCVECGTPIIMDTTRTTVTCVACRESRKKRIKAAYEAKRRRLRGKR